MQKRHPRLRIIQDPMNCLSPEMLFRQVQYLVEEADWLRFGQEVDFIEIGLEE